MNKKRVAVKLRRNNVPVFRRERYLKLNASQFAVSFGLILALFIGVIMFGNIQNGVFQFYSSLIFDAYGYFGLYTIQLISSWLAMVLAMIYGFIDGFIISWIFAKIYNKLA